mmetsp:Transcript_8350/g.16643  ORF Transcript_8350/g.16643 Transcript_8350/m.16643 type:complete len:134 (-) Transcript_8350:865-1266(-)
MPAYWLHRKSFHQVRVVRFQQPLLQAPLVQSQGFSSYKESHHQHHPQHVNSQVRIRFERPLLPSETLHGKKCISTVKGYQYFCQNVVAFATLTSHAKFVIDLLSHRESVHTTFYNKLSNLIAILRTGASVNEK